MDNATSNIEAIVDFSLNLQFEDLPPAVVERGRWVLVDTVGCMLGGAVTDAGRAIVDVLSPLSGCDEAAIIGTTQRADCVTAAFANAVLSDILDYEDTLMAHPSATVVPAALAIGEYIGASGRDVLTAIVAGYEVGVRVGRAIAPTPERAAIVAAGYGWLGFCATVAAARLLGLGREQMLDAFGYVGACSPVPVWISKWERPLHWIKNNFGEQARAGVLATLMAQRGVRAPRRILDSDLGFWRMIGSDRYQPEALTHGLGKRWIIQETTFKPYPCCRYLHTTLDAIRAIREQHSLDASTVDRVVVKSFSEMTDWFADYRPQSLVDAEFSTPYVVALMLLDREPGPGWYETSVLNDPEVLGLADRVQLERDEEYDALFWNERRYAAEVELTTTDGHHFRMRRDWPRGGREVPMTEEELAQKFHALAYTALPANQATRLFAELLAVDNCSDIRDTGRKLGSNTQ